MQRFAMLRNRRMLVIAIAACVLAMVSAFLVFDGKRGTDNQGNAAPAVTAGPESGGNPFAGETPDPEPTESGKPDDKPDRNRKTETEPSAETRTTAPVPAPTVTETVYRDRTADRTRTDATGPDNGSRDDTRTDRRPDPDPVETEPETETDPDSGSGSMPTDPNADEPPSDWGGSGNGGGQKEETESDPETDPDTDTGEETETDTPTVKAVSVNGYVICGGDLGFCLESEWGFYAGYVLTTRVDSTIGTLPAGSLVSIDGTPIPGCYSVVSSGNTAPWVDGDPSPAFRPKGSTDYVLASYGDGVFTYSVITESSGC